MGANAHVLVRFCSWSKKKKWAATLIVSAFTFISPVSSSMMAPAGEQIAGEFGITNSSVIALLTSVFVAAYGESLAMTSCTWEALMNWGHIQPLVLCSWVLSASYTVAPGCCS